LSGTEAWKKLEHPKPEKNHTEADAQQPNTMLGHSACNLNIYAVKKCDPAYHAAVLCAK
jgi:hypothetical protein